MRSTRAMMTALDKLAAIAGRDVHAYPVFGQPVAMGNHTIVPVSAYVISFGAGAGGLPLLSGGGGGGDLRIVPIGFLQEHADEIAFTPIALPEGLVRHGHGNVAKER